MQSYLSEDASSDAALGPAASIAEFKIRSVMCVPLATSEGKALGAIQLDTQDRVKKFGTDDLNLLAIVANLASVAIEKARLHEAALAREKEQKEIELARKVQLGFLPQTLPEVPRVRFAVHYLLCGRVGGDFYDVFRLDERHVGLYVADAMGHGVPASLLTIFVKKGVRAKEVFGQQYRLVPPDEVLYRLNRDLIDQQLSEQPFITMVYALYNHADGTLHFARAGHPYPLLVPAEGPPQFWRQEGLLLGVVDARFPCQTRRLGPGDKLLLYTDGVDTATFEGCPPGADSLLACAERHRHLPVQEFVARLAHDLFGAQDQPDDLTLLALEVCE
jgi:serine phosphatase RsbU (regulator of sigma subunit)